MTELPGRAGIVTGAASGIGSAIAGALVQAGARLVAVDRDEAGARARAEALGADAVAFAADVADEIGLDAAVRLCETRFGRLDYVVANAGVGWAGPFAAADAAAWRRVLDTNVIGLALTLRAALAPMLARGAGHLVAVGSLSGVASYPGETVYIASKWAVIGLVRALRTELVGTPIRLTAVLPGMVDTPMSAGSPAAAELFSEVAPLRPEDVARTVAYALSQPDHVEVSELLVRPRGQSV